MQLSLISSTSDKKSGQTKRRFTGMILFIIFGGILILISCTNGGGGGNDNGATTYSLSGTINMPGNTAVDSDVNDAWASAPQPKSNNTFETAQTISTPVILGGFITVARAPTCAEGGRLCADGDPSDFFKVSLRGDKNITVYVADSMDASLHLYDANQTLLESVTGFSSNLSLSVTDAAGDYFIEVRAQQGSSNYSMTIATGSGAFTSDLNVDQEFVPGEFIVRFKDEPNELNPASNAMAKAQALGLEVSHPVDTGPILVRMQENQKTTLFENLHLQSAIHNTTIDDINDNQRNAKLETIKVIDAMRQRPEVLYAEPNYIRHPLAITPNDEFYYLQWHYPLISLPDAWEAIPDGSGSAVVAVVDTGALMQHPDLIGQLTSDGYDFISDPQRANDGDGRDADPNDSGDAVANGINSYHGTHVSGTIAAASNNGIGVAGVAWRTQTQIMPLRTMGVGGGTSSDILEAVKYAAGLPNSSGLLPNQRADVINLSLGGPDSSAAEAEVFQQVRAQGVIIVAAAGNEAVTTPLYPASYDSVVSVSAVDRYSELAPYSNYGATISVAAPGGDMLMNNLEEPRYPDGVVSTIGNDSNGSVEYTYGFYDGTSMATPHVAGVAALMKSIVPNLSPDTFDAQLINGDLTYDIGAAGKDTQFGYGLIDAYKAVLSAQNIDIQAVLKISPNTLNFGTSETTKSLTAQLLGNGTLRITSVSTDATWVTVSPAGGDLDSDPATVDIPSSLNFQVQIERPEDFLDDTYRATITFESTANTIEVPVTMQKASSDRTSDAGFHYIVLVDPETLDSIYMVEATAQNGQYHYEFEGIEPGRYQVFAGTDMDNDGRVGEVGEASGAYPSLSQQVIINLNQDLTGINFTSGFGVVLSDAMDSILKQSGAKKTGTSGLPSSTRAVKKIN